MALVMSDGLLEYRVDAETGAVLVSDHRDPRSMRSQMYEPGRPEPYLAPHEEDRPGVTAGTAGLLADVPSGCSRVAGA